MFNKLDISPQKQNLIIYIVLTAVTLAVFWQMNQHDFVGIDDTKYVTENHYVQLGITLDGLRWAFGIDHADGIWHPLTGLSLIIDYQLYGLNAGGYHLTNIILHIFSTLLLFWLLHRMTGAIWRSAFVAALFALHPLNVETVAWIALRRDVLCALFSIITLCLYVYYTEAPSVRRYLVTLFAFICALMSKPMVVTLPIIMILIDYWPLRRFKSKKRNLIYWQLQEKVLFLILSFFSTIITIIPKSINSKYNLDISNDVPLNFRIANAPISFMKYLDQIFWPHDLTILQTFSVQQLPVWKVFCSFLLIIIISIVVILLVKRLPYLFVGWLWYAITILPMLKIIQHGHLAMADHYTYLPSIGIFVMLAWGIPLFFQREVIRKKILFPIGATALAILMILTWRQCGYWENTISRLSHVCSIIKNNYTVHHNLASALAEEGNFEDAIDIYTTVISANPNFHLPYFGRGLAYANLGQHQIAIENYNEVIRLKPDYAEFYFNRGNSHDELGQYEKAINDYNEAIRLKPGYIQAYNNRGNTYFSKGNYELGCRDAKKTCKLGNCQLLSYAKNKGYCR